MQEFAKADELLWNHNIHYHPVLLSEISADTHRALDVGCGEGLLTRRLRGRGLEVVGIDADAASLTLARSHPGGQDVDYRLGDFLTHPFEAGSFDAVFSVATLHHMDAVAGLRRMKDLLRPGGVLGVIGLARGGAGDLPGSIVAAGATRILRQGRVWHEPPSPILWPPPATFKDMRRLVATELPGSTFRRRLLWRYTVVWWKPA